MSEGRASSISRGSSPGDYPYRLERNLEGTMYWEWFAKKATRRRDLAGAVDLSNGHWLVRAPSDEYPNCYSRSTGMRDYADWSSGWQEWPEADRMDAVMPVPFGSKPDGMVQLEQESVGFDSVGSPYFVELRSGFESYVPLVAGGIKVHIQRVYYRKIVERRGWTLWTKIDRKPETPIAIVRGNEVIGCLMPTHSPRAER